MIEPRILKVRIAYADDHKRTVVWQDPECDWFSYEVDLDLLVEKAREIRNCLNDFVVQCMKPNGATHCGAELKALAKAGYDLYQALFYNDGTGRNPTEIKEWLRKQENCRINFTVIDRIHIPWGLIFDRDPETLNGQEKDTGIDIYRDFWCIKYQLSSMYSRLCPTRSRSFTSIRLVSVLNQNVFDKVLPHLGDNEKKILDWLNTQYGPSLFGSKELIEKWKSEGEDVDILLFYCHADGTALSLSHNDRLSMHDFKLKLQKQVKTGDTPACLVFLNGCSTAVGEDSGGFLDATSKPGFCGFIGTETSVPDVFAMRYGLTFIFELLNSGKPVYQIANELRVAHWPVSLVYGTYCYPPLQILRSQEPIFPPPMLTNFSTLQLGSNATGRI